MSPPWELFGPHPHRLSSHKRGHYHPHILSKDIIKLFALMTMGGKKDVENYHSWLISDR